jgi:serine protease
MRPTLKLLQVALLVLAATRVGAAETNDGVRHRPGADAEPAVERLIVKFRTSLSIQAAAGNGESTAEARVAAATARVNALAARTNLSMKETHAIGPSMHVMQVTSIKKGEALDDTIARVMADSEVEFAVPDRRVYLHSTPPADTLYSGQWYLQSSVTTPSAIDAATAWDTTQGDINTVIAVVDTGVRFDHPDLKLFTSSGHLLPGYDFISPNSANVFTAANDGDGRDDDASDPGDWVTAGDNCGQTSNSSWHGTRVSGIIGALTNNNKGVAGINWNVKILPVRVIGKCGGFNSDVIAGLNWAAGIDIPNVPHNNNPAKIINVSLGGEGSCDSASANAISTLASLGVLVVVSAGNEGGPVDSPANCPGAMGIAGLRHIGTKVGYSSLGPEIKLAAPAGNCPDDPAGCMFSIDTTTNLGTQSPVPNNESYTGHSPSNRNIGTSFSSPIVSGIAGLMLAVNSNLKSSQLILRLQEGAKPFPTTSDTVPLPPVCHTPASASDVQGSECICTTAVCGAGMANAPGAIAAALRPIAVISSVNAGANVSLDGNGSTAANGHSITGYTWMKGGAQISNTSTASIATPASGTATACLTVIDDTGKQDTAVATVAASQVTLSSAKAGTNPCLSEVSVTATDNSASEAGPGTGTFTLTRSGDTTAALAVTISMSGTAGNGSAYQTIATTVNFAAGSPTATVTLTPIDDSIVNGSRTATLNVQNGANYTAGSPSSATITIADNDVAAPAPQASGGGGGGGGAIDPLMLMGLALGVLVMLGQGRRRFPLPRHAKQFRQHVTTEQRRPRR